MMLFHEGEKKVRALERRIAPVLRWDFNDLSFRPFHAPIRELVPRLTDNAHTAPPTELFDAANEAPIRHHIIALGLHDHHEIAGPFHIE